MADYTVLQSQDPSGIDDTTRQYFHGHLGSDHSQKQSKTKWREPHLSILPVVVLSDVQKVERCVRKPDNVTGLLAD